MKDQEMEKLAQEFTAAGSIIAQGFWDTLGNLEKQASMGTAVKEALRTIWDGVKGAGKSIDEAAVSVGQKIRTGGRPIKDGFVQTSKGGLKTFDPRSFVDRALGYGVPTAAVAAPTVGAVYAGHKLLGKKGK